MLHGEDRNWRREFYKNLNHSLMSHFLVSYKYNVTIRKTPPLNGTISTTARLCAGEN